MKKRRGNVTIELSGNAHFDKVRKRARLGLMEGAIIGDSNALQYFPRDTGNLINSQALPKIIEDETGVAVLSVNTAAYAMPVHDPDNPQNFNLDRSPLAQKEFLTRGHDEVIPEKTQALVRRLKSA